MGLYLLHGLNGSGKTYHAVKDYLIPALKAGRPVITNIDGIDKEYIHIIFDIPYENLDKLVLYPPGDDLMSAGGFDDPMSRFFEICQKQTNTVVIFDEIQAYYASVAWKENPNRTAFANYITQHRKFGDDFIAMTPDASKVDSSIRGIFHYNIHFKKADMIGQSKRYFYNIRYSSDFIGTPLKTGTGTYEDKYHRAYKSFRAEEEGKTKMSSFRYAPKSLLVAAVVAVVAIGWGGWKYWSSRKAASAPVAAPAPASDAGGIGQSQPHPRELPLVSYPRLAGYISESDNFWRLLGCDGETIGFSHTDPRENGSQWASCAERADSSAESSGPEFGAF